MEDTGYKFDQVHVLRHTFWPNEPLKAELMRIAPEAEKPFVIYGSDERVVPLFDATSRRFNIERRDANKIVEANSHGNFQLENSMEARALRSKSQGMVALQLAMSGRYTTEYEKLISALDHISAGEHLYAPGFYATRLYVTIPVAQLGPLDEARERVHTFKKSFDDESARRLYQVAPNPYLNELTTQRRIGVPSDSDTPAPRAS